jgi:hypothetical protein
MSAITYDDTRVAAQNSARAAAARKGLLGRIINRVVEVRLQQAAREVELHLGYLPYSLDQRGNRLVKTGHKDVPFGG